MQANTNKHKKKTAQSCLIGILCPCEQYIVGAIIARTALHFKLNLETVYVHNPLI